MLSAYYLLAATLYCGQYYYSHSIDEINGRLGVVVHTCSP